MALIKDDNAERLDRITRNLERLQGEMEALREEGRVIAEQMRVSSRAASTRAKQALSDADSTARRVAGRVEASTKRTRRKVR